MKLVCSNVPTRSDPKTELYRNAKSFYREVEALNDFTLRLVQALLLIALYELGHGICPAAYLTIGSLATIGHAMGLHKPTTPQMLPPAETAMEEEERKRWWWCVVILERFIHIGHRNKPLATAGPDLRVGLGDDAAFDNGTITPAAASGGTGIPGSPFVRTCQAAVYLGRTIAHIENRSIPLNVGFDQALRLLREMQNFARCVYEEVDLYNGAADAAPERYTGVAIIFSALLTLCQFCDCTARFDNSKVTGGVSRQDLQEESFYGRREIDEMVLLLAARLRRQAERVGGLRGLSPLVVNCIYQATMNCTSQSRWSS